MEEWYHASKKNQNKVEEFNGFDKWKEVTLLFEKLQQEYPKRFYLLRYDNLLTETEKEVKKMFSFCDLEYTNETKEFIRNSSQTDLSDDAYSVFRKDQMDDKWKNKLKYLKGIYDKQSF